jgi:hypothetical protein
MLWGRFLGSVADFLDHLGLVSFASDDAGVNFPCHEVCSSGALILEITLRGSTVVEVSMTVGATPSSVPGVLSGRSWILVLFGTHVP